MMEAVRGELEQVTLQDDAPHEPTVQAAATAEERATGQQQGSSAAPAAVTGSSSPDTGAAQEQAAAAGRPASPAHSASASPAGDSTS
jgi:hypothetical protein